MQSIVLGGGCFWCTEAVFLQVQGVQRVTSGYMGGDEKTANYPAVCTGTTGHVEVIKVDYDDITLATLLDIFFAIHDPTTPNRQGDDIGTQYASTIFYHNEHDKAIIDNKINALKAEGIEVVTAVRPIQTFYPAEDYHQDYFNKNPKQSYCNLAIPPKLAKLRSKFYAWSKVKPSQ